MQQPSRQDRDQAMAQATEKIRRKLEDGRGRRLNFLLLGRTGKGKSSTVNSFFGQEVAPVGDYEPTTITVEQYDHEINGIPVRIWDTPGLCDDLEEEDNDRRYLQEVCEKIKEIDSVWFVASLDDTRVGADEKRGIQEISLALGKEVWQRGLIVFTFADKVSPDEYPQRLQKRAELIRQEISKYAGDRIARHILAVAVNNKGNTTPDGEPWLGELFAKVFTRLDNNALAPFLLVMSDSLTVSRSARAAALVPAGAGSSFGPPPLEEEMPRIVLNSRQDQEVRNKLQSAGYTVTGAATGAGIGSLVLGPVGAVVGAVAGGLIGWVSSKLFG